MLHNLTNTTAPALLAIAIVACSDASTTADFAYFEYSGADPCHAAFVDDGQSYCNPILGGYYPDPSVCRVGDTFYMVNSSFAHFPAVPVFSSHDLVHWQQIGHVLDRPEQVNLDGLDMAQGIYAPTIRYCETNHTFYVITTCVGCGGNFVVKATDPRGPWSNPIWLPAVGGIDPSLFFDVNGLAYIVNNDAPQEEPQWDGHRALWLHQYDLDRDTTVGHPVLLVDGGVRPADKPVWIEGPHLYRINGKYYLMAAEGGTGDAHSEVLFVSDDVMGPYTPAKVNPILTQRDLPRDRQMPVTCTGHADIVDDADGQYYAVFLGCRPNASGTYNTGRETFLLPVTMTDEGFVILPKGEAVPYVVHKSNLHKPDSYEPTGGSFAWRTDFDDDTLPERFVMIRRPAKRWYDIANSALRLHPQSIALNSRNNPAFLAVRQQHIDFSAQTQVDFVPRSDGDMAGLACFQNDDNYILFGKTRRDGRERLEVLENKKGKLSLAAHADLPNDAPLTLRVASHDAHYHFQCLYHGDTVNVASVDATHLSTDRAGGFVGAVVGMFAVKSK